MVSLGFSVQAEHAHQNQQRFLILKVLGQRTTFNHEHGRGRKAEKITDNNINIYLKFESIIFTRDADLAAMCCNSSSYFLFNST